MIDLNPTTVGLVVCAALMAIWIVAKLLGAGLRAGFTVVAIGALLLFGLAKGAERVVDTAKRAVEKHHKNLEDAAGG